VAHGRFHGAKGAGLAGAIFLSGLYEFAKVPPGAPEKAYFGDDPAKLAEGSSLGKLPASPLPLMLVYAELDPPSFIEQAKLLNEALCKAGRCPRLVRLPKHNHMSQVYAINTPDTDLSDEIVAFVKSGK
jgi:triacylglycerol lipase